MNLRVVADRGGMDHTSAVRWLISAGFSSAGRKQNRLVEAEDNRRGREEAGGGRRMPEVMMNSASVFRRIFRRRAGEGE